MKLQPTLLATALALSVAVAAFAFAQTSNNLPDSPGASIASSLPNGPTVIMDTSMGRITCQFYQRQAPKTVANFIALAEGTKNWTDPVTQKVQHHKPYFDGTTFHRVIPKFMIQGGDPTGTGMGGPGYTFDDEFDPHLNFDRPGKLAMANSGPNTNGSQFFITEVPTPWLNGHHTIFGQCDDPSVEVVMAIARVPRNSSDKPNTPVVLKMVTIVRTGQPLPAKPGEKARAAIAEPASKVNLSHTTPHRLPYIDAKLAERHLISNQRPVYPKDAKKANISGTVIVAVLIRADGTVQLASAISGPKLLRTAAEESVKKWRYTPFLVHGKPSVAQTHATVVFELKK